MAALNVVIITRVLTASGLALLLASACGGASFSRDDDPRGGTSTGGSSGAGTTATSAGEGGTDPGRGGSSRGGSSSAGTSSGGTGGTSSGGTSSGGTGSGGTGSGGTGSGGTGGEGCTAPPVGGNCDGALRRWFHDPLSGLCRPFTYGGCGGNENNYDSLAACQAACPVNTPNYDSCTVSTDCAVVLESPGCCGSCDRPGLVPWNLLAVNKQQALGVGLCALGAAPPGAPPGKALPCAPCPTLTDDSGSLKFFVPNCIKGQCVVEDVRTSPVSTCEKDADCEVRNGNDCCESCGVVESIAVNRSGALEKLLCGATPPGCPECEIAQGEALAACGASGHCELVYAQPAR